VYVVRVLVACAWRQVYKTSFVDLKKESISLIARGRVMRDIVDLFFVLEHHMSCGHL
jgi:hypothetical protein